MTTRRDFLLSSSAVGAGLWLGWRFSEGALAADAPPTAAPQSDWAPNAWVRVRPDGKVELVVGKCEIGQGVRTALPMILADELGADWSSIELIQAQPGIAYPRLGTGGSGSVMWAWANLRTAGAAAREMLIAAAAARFGVGIGECVARDGVVSHTGGQRATFGELAEAASRLPVPDSPRLRSEGEGNVLGRRLGRVDAPAIVTGAAIYGLDVRRPGQLYAAIERSPRIGGKLVRFDADSARKLPGVVDVVAIPEGVAVIATNSWQALGARAGLEIVWDEGALGGAASFDSAKFAALLREGAQTTGVVTRLDGRGLEAWADAPHRLEAVYEYPFYAHSPIEPMNATALFTPKGESSAASCTIWAPTQTPNNVQTRVAERLGLTAEQVEVHVTLSGGGFGRRLHWDYALEAASVAQAVPGRPVQVVWSRADDLRHGFFQSASAHRVAAAWSPARQPIAWAHRKVSALHNARGGGPTAEELASSEYLRDSQWGVYDVPYQFAHVQTEYVPRPIDVPIGPWRAVFAPSSIFARECFFDELAHALGRDPIELRLELLAGTAELKAGSLTIDRARLRGLLERLREVSGWTRELAPVPEGSRAGLRRGRGVACEVYDGDTHVGYVAEVAIADGRLRVERLVCAVDAGRIVNPSGAEQQVESGVAWSLSSLFGGAIEFRAGRATAGSFAEAPVLRIGRMPALEIHFVGSGRDRPFGLGEPTVSSVVPAVLNAVYAATGQRIRKLPLLDGVLPPVPI